MERPSTAAPNTAVQLLHRGRIRLPERVAARVRRELRRKVDGPGISAAEVDNSLVIGEKTYNELVVNLTSRSTSRQHGCSTYATSPQAARRSGAPERRPEERRRVISRRTGRRTRATRGTGPDIRDPGLLSMMFVVAALASVSSAFVSVARPQPEEEGTGHTPGDRG